MEERAQFIPLALQFLFYFVLSYQREILVYLMFILNALCCSSDTSNPHSSVKTKSIRKVFTEHTVISPIASPTAIKEAGTKTNQPHASFQFDAVTTTFNLTQSCVQIRHSDVSNCGSERKQLEESQFDKFVSPVDMSEISSEQKQNELMSVSSENLNGNDFIDIDVKQWSVKDVLKFLSKIGMRNYNTTFYKNKIKGKDFVSLSEKQLRQDLSIHDKDIKTLTLYIQLLKQRVSRQSKQRVFSKTFNVRRRSLSWYKSFSNTYSSRKILNMVKNPIIEEDGEQEHPQHYQRIGNMTTKDMYSTTNFSDLLTN